MNVKRTLEKKRKATMLILAGLMFAAPLLATPAAATHDVCSQDYLERNPGDWDARHDTTRGTESRWWKVRYTWANTEVRVAVAGDGGFLLKIWSGFNGCPNGLPETPNACNNAVVCQYTNPSFVDSGAVHIEVVPTGPCVSCDTRPYVISIHAVEPGGALTEKVGLAVT